MIALNEFDRALLLATQEGMPLCREPYRVIAERLNSDVETVKARLIALQERGAIRRLGAIPNHYALGYRHNGMTVWDVPDDQVDELGRAVAALDGISHCYRRPRHLPDWRYNLFAMVHGRTAAEMAGQVDRIRATLGAAVEDHAVIVSTSILKKTGLRVAE